MFANGLTTGVLAVLLAGSQLAAAHMEISYPPPFRSKFNPHATNIDYTNTAPLSESGSNFPCKLYHQDMGTPAGASVATFAPGQTYNFTVAGSASHGGGSCQVSLSYDGGKTFTVIESIIGGCPLASNYPFTIPADAPQGSAIWAWTWNNNIGNREQYMNCASVTIGGGAAKRATRAPAKPRAAFSARPQIFVANIGNGCRTIEGTDVEYPNPGPDAVVNPGKLGAPVGDCGSGAGAPVDNTPPAQSSSQVSEPAPTPTSDDNSNGLPGGIFITEDNGSASTSEAPAPTPETPSVTTSAKPVATTPAKEPSTPAPAPTTSSSSQEAATSTTSQAPAPTKDSGSGKGNNSNAESFSPGTACADEGLWNCVGGYSFQRCAAGQWSPIMQLAPGTKCKVGQVWTFTIEAAKKAKRAGAEPRFRSAKMRRFAA
ncbi:hypothetical protein VTJ83DRAFT_6857 [Remersonia thermophila]|uniref:Extracellular protein n=1 Tax=Remersonia thermophila TaxID=72144 RepID=A0ABR4D846_9PEZI